MALDSLHRSPELLLPQYAPAAGTKETQLYTMLHCLFSHDNHSDEDDTDDVKVEELENGSVVSRGLYPSGGPLNHFVVRSPEKNTEATAFSARPIPALASLRK